jgi:hypothetical protein
VSTPFDRRAEAAAAAVRAAVADLQPAPGQGPEPFRRRWPALVAAVVLLVTAIGGVVLLRRDDGDTVVAGPGDEVPRLVVGDLPDGLRPTGASDLPAEGSVATTFRLYGRGTGEDPSRDGDVAVFVLLGQGSVAPIGGNVTVRGVDGSLTEDETFGRTLAWEEPDVGSVFVMSHSLPRAQLLEVAASLRRSGDDLVLERPPDGFRLIADLRGVPGVTPGVVVPGDRGSTVRYQSDDGERMLTVTGIGDSPGALDTVRWLGGERTRRVEVRGHDAWLAPSTTEAIMPVTTLGWRERPGRLVTVAGTGLSDEELRTAAEGLRQADDAEWADLLGSTDDAVDTAEDATDLAVSPPWRYTQDDDGSLCFEVERADGVASGSCSGPDALADPRVYEGAEQVDEGWWLHGRVPDRAVRVAVQAEGGERQVVDTIADEGGGRVWAALLPEPGRTVTITALDGGAAEVDRYSGPPEEGWVGG